MKWDYSQLQWNFQHSYAFPSPLSYIQRETATPTISKILECYPIILSAKSKMHISLQSYSRTDRWWQCWQNRAFAKKKILNDFLWCISVWKTRCTLWCTNLAILLSRTSPKRSPANKIIFRASWGLRYASKRYFWLTRIAFISNLNYETVLLRMKMYKFQNKICHFWRMLNLNEIIGSLGCTILKSSFWLSYGNIFNF